MTPGGTDDSRLSKNQRREAAREKAKQLREEQRKREVRNRVILFSSLGLVLVAIVVGVTLVITSTIRPAGPGPANMASDGIVIGQGFVAQPTAALAAGEDPIPTETDPASGVVDIRLYVDYLCPYCGQFETTNNEQMGEWIDSGAATVEIHPLSILDRASLGSRYSTRAANAAACVANYSPDQFWAFNGLLYTNQPEENTEGLDNAALKDLVSQAGVTEQSSIDSCIDDTTFRGWVEDATTRALNDPLPGTDFSVEGTPTVLVNGQKYSGSLTDPDAFSAFVVQVAGEAYDDSTATPTPTPSAEPTETPAG
ncbi:DsbA family protein [Herbiconiux moechotypicola]|uniref:Thioredoxin domain-containing protein n=1 Tax=Herbiconiux moechotypicola TaxID=637393 RepID=A0ABN3DSN2_9MICO|nr:DsbA family protein [Herbiconiux moechotypicola]MCS5730692.1 DsbA family protein [Herbiconiux moechotypicola]